MDVVARRAADHDGTGRGHRSREGKRGAGARLVVLQRGGGEVGREARGVGRGVVDVRA